MSKQKTNWMVDAILFIGFLLTFFLDWTGLSLHQWLGVFIGALALYHLLIHWKWVVAVTKRFVRGSSRQSRLYYVLDGIILFTFLLIGVSGLWISTWLDLDLANYLIWKDLHVYISLLSLALILIKIAAHWRWIIKTARTYFGLWKTPAPATASVVSAGRPQNGSLNRREFLQLMGVAGVASLLSASNLIDLSQAASQSILEEKTAPPDFPDINAETLPGSESSCQVICDQGCTYPGQCRRYIDQNGNGICDLTECASTDTSSQTTEQQGPYQEDQEAFTPDTEFSTLEGNQESGECVVLCPKGCVYPGECQDYRDLNGNGLCDLGECLESNTEPDITTSRHSGAGGRQRKGKN